MSTRVGLALPLLLVGTAVAWTWNGGHRAHQATAPTAEEEAAEAAASPLTLVVDFQDDITAEALAANSYVEEAVSRYSAVDKLYRIRFSSAAEAARAAAALARDPDVESVDHDVEATLFPQEATATAEPFAECGAAPKHEGFPNDPCFRYQWHLRQVGLPDAWKMGQGKGAIVAVIDTGVTRVPDLHDVKMVPGYNFVADTENAADDHGHGTHVAGTIAQATNNKLGVGGVAFGATIMPLKVLSASGSGSMAAIAQAIRWAADHKANVINMSLGGPFPVGAIRNAIDYARNKGVVVIAAAGNDGRGKVGYPARYPGVIAVAATQFDETTTFYSNWGKEIDIAGPGGNTRVDQNGDGKPDGVLQNTVVPGRIRDTDYLWFMGTSMATPHVAGVAALIVGAGVTKPDAVERILLETARKPKGKSVEGRIDDRYGAGLVDAGAALKKARVGKDVGGVGLAGAIALLGLGRLRRRGLAFIFIGALLTGAVGLLELGGGNPLLLSAALPITAVAFLFGVARLRPLIAGLAFGVAGALLFGAIASVADVRVVPDFLDRAWLLANATVAALIGRGVSSPSSTR